MFLIPTRAENKGMEEDSEGFVSGRQMNPAAFFLFFSESVSNETKVADVFTSCQREPSPDALTAFPFCFLRYSICPTLMSLFLFSKQAVRYDYIRG